MKTLLATTLVSALCFGASANATPIDSFNAPYAANVQAITDTLVGGGVVFQEYGYSDSILGGYRDLIIELLAVDKPGGANVYAEVSGGSYSFSTSSLDIGRGRIQWDGQDGSAALNYTGLNHADLVNMAGCQDGCSQFVASVLGADLGFEYQIGVYTNQFNYTILTSNTLFPITTSYESVYDFAWFSLATGNHTTWDGMPFHITHVGTGANFADVGAVEFVINSNGGAVAVDLALDSASTVYISEPSVLSLVGLGLVGLGLTRRRVA